MSEKIKLKNQFVNAVRKLSEKDVREAIDQLNGDNYRKVRRYFLGDKEIAKTEE